MKMKTTDYKRLLSQYTPKVLEEIRYLTESLELRLKNTLTIPEIEMVRTGLRSLTVHADRQQEILDLMRYDWNIFSGDHIRFSYSTNAPLEKALIIPENLNNLIKAVYSLIEQRSSQRLKFLFDGKHVLVQEGKKKPIVIGARETYQEGLIKALSDPRVGIIKNVDAVLETMNQCKTLPVLNTSTENKTFIRNQMTELQSKLKSVHLGGKLTLKWSDNNRNISFQVKS